MDQFNACDTT